MGRRGVGRCALLLVGIPAVVLGAGVGYEYDALGRLQAVQYSDGKRIAYSLDGTGNRSALTTSQMTGETVGWMSALQQKVAVTSGSVTLTVWRVGDAANPASLDWATVTEPWGNPAVPGQDFVHANGFLQWSANDTSPRSITITILDNQVPDEPEKWFVVELSNPVNVTIAGNPISVVWIVDL